MTTLPSSSNPTTHAAQTSTESAQRSYANATKKQTPTGPAVVSSNVGGTGQAQQHGKRSSISPVNGKTTITPAVPAVGGPTIVNSNAVNGTPVQPDHSRKPSSVTISASGSSGYISNGTTSGPPNRPNIAFGSMNTGGSPAIAHSAPLHPQTSTLATPVQNPRVTSPATSPSPIPQPGPSGGRPPAGLQTGNNGPVFGSMGGESNGEHNARPISIPGPPPQAQHLRRESSQSAHSDMSNTPLNRNFRPTPGRGGNQFTPSYGPPTHQSPVPPYRQLPNQQRGGPHMAAPFQNQGQMTHPNSPYRATRSPAMAPAQMQQQMQYANQQPMPHAYGGYQPQYQAQQGMYMPATAAYDPNAAAYYGYNQAYVPSMQFQGPPPSPRPPFAPHTNHQPFIQGQYNPHHTTGMQRSPSQVSERPPSTLGQPQTPSMTAATHASQTPSHTSSSPAPSSNFQLPNRSKSKGIVIKNSEGEVVTFDKKAASPAPPASGGPVVVSSTPTPPPRVPSTAGSLHGRTDSNAGKTAEEKKLEFQERVKKQLEADRVEALKKKDDEDHKLKQEADDKAAKDKEDAQKAAKEKEAAEQAERDRLAAEKAKEDEKKAAEEVAEKKRKEEEEFERMVAEMEAQEKEDEEREKKFQEKRKQEQAEAKLREAEAAAKADEEMRRLEREAEEREEANAKKTSTDEIKDDDEAKKLFASLKKPTLGPGALSTPDSGASTPTSEVAMPPPPQPVQPRSSATGGKPKPVPLKLETSKPVEPAQPTAGMQSLKTSRFLEVMNELNIYPAGIKSPNPALNLGKSKARQYDKNFLLQFQEVFKEKPSVDWDSKLKETVGDGSESARPQSARTPSMMGGRQPSRSGVPSGLSGPMGNFIGTGGRTLPSGTTSEQRFLASQGGTRGPTMNNPLAQFANRPGGFAMGGAPPMARTSSYQNMPQPNSPRTGSTRGKGSRRGDNRAASKRDDEAAAKSMPLTAGQDLKPLEISGGGWKPTSVGKGPVQASAPLPGGHLPPDLVQRKVKAALNKMTPENFDRIADQILNIAAQSKDEDDGRTLRQVIQLTFEKACDEAHWASMYAKFCKRMLETMSPEIKDDNVRDKNGNPVVGGALFRKYLLNRCQEDFERGWDVDLPDKPEGQNEQEAVMLSDEYYIAAAAKRKGLGLIQFIGELYKLGMLTLRIMHECVMRLLNFEGAPDESALESLVKLIRTIGATMENTEQGPNLLGNYFERINMIVGMEGLTSRHKFMLMDILDLRRKGWRSKDDSKGPKTIQEIHNEAAAAQQAAEVERMRSKQGGGRPMMGRGDVRSASGASMMAPDLNKSQIGMDDLRKLTKGAAGRTTSQGPSGFGPTSLFAGRSSSGRRGLGPVPRGEDSGPSSRTTTPPVKDKEPAHHQNSFSALAALDTTEHEETVASPPSAASSPPVQKTQPRPKSPAKESEKTEA